VVLLVLVVLKFIVLLVVDLLALLLHFVNSVALPNWRSTEIALNYVCLLLKLRDSDSVVLDLDCLYKITYYAHVHCKDSRTYFYPHLKFMRLYVIPSLELSIGEQLRYFRSNSVRINIPYSESGRLVAITRKLFIVTANAVQESLAAVDVDCVP